MNFKTEYIDKLGVVFHSIAKDSKRTLFSKKKETLSLFSFVLRIDIAHSRRTTAARDRSLPRSLHSHGAHAE